MTKLMRLSEFFISDFITRISIFLIGAVERVPFTGAATP